MAVELRAVAKLSAKPFRQTLKQLGKSVSAMGKETAAATGKATNGTLAQADANQQLMQSAKGAGREVVKTGKAGTATMRDLTDATTPTVSALQRVGDVATRVSQNVSKMTRAETRLESAREAASRARVHAAKTATILDQQRAAGLEGPALQRYIDQDAKAQRALGRAAIAHGTAIKAVDDERARAAKQAADATDRKAAADEKANAKTREAADRQNAHNRALADGAAKSKAFSSALTGLTGQQMKLAQASRAMTTAQEGLTRAHATGKGIAAAEGRVISTTRAYNELASAAAAGAASQAAMSKGVSKASTGLSAQRYLFHDLSRQLATSSLAVAALPATALIASAAWEKSFANVQRTADPKFSAAPERLAALRDSLVGMAQSMPASFGEITEIATLANQMGIASSQTAEFTRATAMFAATSGVSVDMAATAFGRLTSIMGKQSIGFMDMSDSILKVGVNSVATEDEIINVTTQISSIAQQAGFSTKDIIGLSGALASVRVPPELSRGVVTRVMGQIDKAVQSGSTGLDTLARLSGTTAEKFREHWGSEGSSKLFQDFVQGLHEAGPAALSELQSLGITSVRDKPVMLRLANAADSEGNEGGLLAQTNRDANQAAGETQRQYTVMAETVAAKFKMLGNNIMAFFDAAGSSGLGMLGDVIEGASKGLRNLSRALEEPHALLGIFGQTNGDVVGLIGTVALAISAFTLLGSAMMKVFAATATIRSASVAIPALLGIGGAGGAGGFAAIGGAAAKGAGGFGAISTKAGAASKAVGGFRGAGGGLTSFLMGPWGIALAAGAAAISIINSKMEEGATDIGEFSNGLASIDTSSVVSLDNELKKLSVKGPDELGGWEMNTNPFEDGVQGFKDSLAEIHKIQQANEYDWFGSKQTFEFGQWLERGLTGSWDEIQGIEAVDEAIQNLVDAGNGPKAAAMIQSLTGSGEALSTWINKAEGANTKNFLKNAFELADIDMTDQALDKFARGTLPELTDAMVGVKGASLNAAELFEGDFDRLAEFAQRIDEASAAFLDYNKALEAGTQLNEDGSFQGFDLSKWSESMKQDMEAQEQWGTNLQELAKSLSPDALAKLADMGPEGKSLAAYMAEGIRNGTPEAVEAAATLEAAVLAETSGTGSAIADQLANINWLQAMGDKDASAKLLSSLDGDTIAKMREAGKGLGQETVDGILEGLADDGDVKAALKKFELAQPRIPVSTSFEGEAVENGLSALQKKLETDNTKLKIETDLDTGTTVADLRGILDNPELNKMSIDGDLTLTEAYADSRAFQVWAKEQGIDVFLGANDLPARTTLRTLEAFAAGTVVKAQLDALPNLAEKAVWDLVTFANGKTGFVQVNAETGFAMESVAHVYDEVTGKTVAIPLDANDELAIATANSAVNTIEGNPATLPIKADDSDVWSTFQSIDGHNTSSTHTITTVERKTFETHGIPFLPESKAPAANPFYKADGGMLAFYANGGVRESHRAQIAPAGTMRVWAEPETGGEAYIPLARSKRKRSTAILNDVANRFGLSVGQSDAARYADGGTYYAQHASRAASSAYAGPSNGGLSASDREFFNHLFRTVVVTAEGQRITGLTNNINETNARFGR